MPLALIITLSLAGFLCGYGLRSLVSRWKKCRARRRQARSRRFIRFTPAAPAPLAAARTAHPVGAPDLSGSERRLPMRGAEGAAPPSRWAVLPHRPAPTAERQPWPQREMLTRPLHRSSGKPGRRRFVHVAAEEWQRGIEIAPNREAAIEESRGTGPVQQVLPFVEPSARQSGR